MYLKEIDTEDMECAFELYQIPDYVLETVPEDCRGDITGAVYDVSSGELGDVYLTESNRPYDNYAQYHEPSYWQRTLQMLRRFERAVPMTRQADNAAVAMAALLQELVDEQEPKPVAWIIQNRLTQACYVYATEQPADPNHIQVPVYTAPPAPEPEPSVPDGLIQNLVQTAMRGLLTDDDMANLRRFDECCQDSDADGHAVAKPKMKRLELAGVVRSCGFGRHETTAFGDWLLADAPEQPTSVPVLTVECEPDYWSGGHYYEGTKPHIAPTAVWKLPIGTKLYTSPPANNQSEQHLEMVNAPAPSVPDEQLQAAFDRGLKAGNEQAIAQQIEIHKLHDFLAVQQPAQPAELVRDAERYRWLRAYNTAKHPSVTEAFFLGDENLDAEIDAAIATEKGNKND